VHVCASVSVCVCSCTRVCADACVCVRVCVLVKKASRKSSKVLKYWSRTCNLLFHSMFWRPLYRNRVYV